MIVTFISNVFEIRATIAVFSFLVLGKRDGF